jgi:geranylgeranyl pyrophosphate synthase
LRRRVVCELCAGAGSAGMVAGQVLDLEAERAPVGLAQLRRIHALKTGALFRAALRIGALLGGGSEASVEGLGRFGERLGLAFQITDDVLDVTMDAAALGKTPGKDRDAHKTTFASLLGVEGAERAARSEAADAIGILRTHALASDVLEGLAGFAVDRRR